MQPFLLNDVAPSPDNVLQEFNSEADAQANLATNLAGESEGSVSAPTA